MHIAIKFDFLSQCVGKLRGWTPYMTPMATPWLRHWSTALSNALKEIISADVFQLSYDERFDTKSKVESYVLLGQFTNERSKAEKVIAVNSFPPKNFSYKKGFV